MKRILKFVMILGALVGVVFGGARAFAHAAGRHHDPAAMKARVSAHIDEVLDAAHATDAQKAAIAAARDHVFAVMKEQHESRRGEMAQALALFQQDKLDPTAMEAHRAQQKAHLKAVGDAFEQAFRDAHDTLTAEQRKAVVDYVRAHAPKAREGKADFRQNMMRHFVEQRVDDALAEIKATDAQRKVVYAARDRVLQAVQSSRGDHRADMEQLLTLFSADKIDAQQVAALRAQHQDRITKVGDAVMQSVREVHDALDPNQRKVLAGYLKAHHEPPTTVDHG